MSVYDDGKSDRGTGIEEREPEQSIQQQRP